MFFQYWKHKDKSDVAGTLVFSIEAANILEADKAYKKATGQDVTKQPDVGVTVQ